MTTILIVDDNEDILFNLDLLLTFNNYSVKQAHNGQEALQLLREDSLPDLILCDIMMPEMDGYSFLKRVNQNPLWINIPFIFLTAKSSREDIKFGKLLGVDDYITKPFDKDLLLATIAGKLVHKSKITLLTEELDKKLNNITKLLNYSPPAIDGKNILLLWSMWDEIQGPSLKECYSKTQYSFNIEQVSVQMYQAASTIYGYTDYTKAECILLNLRNIEMNTVIFFDAITDKTVRGEQRQYMLAVLAPTINYLEYLSIRPILATISEKIKRQEKWNIEEQWKIVQKVISGTMEISLKM